LQEALQTEGTNDQAKKFEPLELVLAQRCDPTPIQGEALLAWSSLDAMGCGAAQQPVKTYGAAVHGAHTPRNTLIIEVPTLDLFSGMHTWQR